MMVQKPPAGISLPGGVKTERKNRVSPEVFGPLNPVSSRKQFADRALQSCVSPRIRKGERKFDRIPQTGVDTAAERTGGLGIETPHLLPVRTFEFNAAGVVALIRGCKNAPSIGEEVFQIRIRPEQPAGGKVEGVNSL